jgi:hypothetical protein
VTSLAKHNAPGMRRRIFRHIADNHFFPGITRLKIVNDRMGNFSRYDSLPLLWISRMFFMLVLISVFCLFLNDAGFVFLKQRRATYRAVYLWGDRCDLPPAGVLATIDGERLASDELGSLKIKNRVDNLAYLAFVCLLSEQSFGQLTPNGRD